MFKSFKNFLIPFLVLFLLFIASWRFMDYFFKNETLDQQEEYLEKKGTLLEKQLSFSEENPSADEKSLIRSFVEDTEERITLLDGHGTILYDSSNPDLHGSRSNRPEVKEVLKHHRKGSSLRFSDTLKEELLYVALPLKNKQQLSGILRIAEPTAGFNQKAESFRKSIFLVLAVIYLVLSFLIGYLIWQRNRPIQTVLPVLKKMADEPDKASFIVEDSSQWHELYQTINQLSEQMQHTYSAYASTEEQFNTLLADLPLGVMILDEQGTIELINPTMQKILTVNEIPKTIWSVIQDPKLLQLINRTATEPQIHEEITLSDPPLILDVTLRSLTKPDGGKQVMGIFYDLSRIRNLEKIQKDFVGNVSHELKTPVTSLIGFTETLLDGAKDDPETTTKFLQIMQKDAKRLQALIQDIIQLSKDEDTAIHEALPLRLYPFLQELCARYQLLISEKNLTIEISGDPQFVFQTQLELFQPIIKNLFENALQYSPKDAKVLLTYKVQNQQLFLSIQDFGLGIDADDQERIFERFYRVDKARTRYSGGTGLGLAIVKENTEKLKGSLSLKSYPGTGSTFTLTLPIQNSADSSS